MVLTDTEQIHSSPSIPPHPSKPQPKKEKPATKVVIRRLPPGMTRDEFLTQVSPIPDHDYMYIIKGEQCLGENAFSRVYVNFSHASDIYVFKEKFDNYVFVDGKGHEYSAVVEFAAFQKVPKKKRARNDPKMATIESDPAYIEFLDSLNEQPNADEKPEYSYNLTATSLTAMDKTTPLLDFLKQRKVDRMRIREEKRDERRKKDQERKKTRDEERKRRLDDKKAKHVPNEAKDEETKESPQEKEKSAKGKSFKNRKYEEKKMKPKPFKQELKSESSVEKPKEASRKMKKYSEKREERKNVEEAARKAVCKKNEEEMSAMQQTEGAKCTESKSDDEEIDGKSKNKENDPRIQRRIRNKDRPTMQLYKPGMLRKKSVDNEKENMNIVESEKCGESSHGKSNVDE